MTLADPARRPQSATIARVPLPRHGPARHLGSRRLWTVLALSALVVAASAWLLLRPAPSPLTPVDRYPGTAPGEWGPGATWASPPLMAGTRPVAANPGDVALVTADRRLLLVDLTSGVLRWEARLPAGEVTTPPTPTRVDGQDVLAAHVGDRVVWWRVQDGDSDGIDVPGGATMSMLGEVPLVAVGGAQVLALVDDRAAAVRVPESTTALAAHADGSITTAGAHGWWHLTKDGSVGSRGDWETSGAMPTVAGYTAGFILLVRPGSPDSLELHADRTTDVRFVTGAPVALPAGAGGALTWFPSPSRTWGVLGRTLVDLKAGTITDLGAWSTRTITADRAYGHIDGQAIVVGPAIPRGVLSPGEPMPDVITAAGAVVRGPAPSGDDPPSGGVDPRRSDDVAYFLPPRKTAS